MTPAALLARAGAAGCRVFLRADGVVRVEPAPPADLLADLRQHRDAIAAELRRQASVPAGDVEAAGELAAVAREGEVLRRVEVGLGEETDATLWRVLDRLLGAHDLALADRLWQHVVAADRRGIYSRLVGWVRSLDAAGADIARVRALVDAGPGRHAYHDAGAP